MPARATCSSQIAIGAAVVLPPADREPPRATATNPAFSATRPEAGLAMSCLIASRSNPFEAAAGLGQRLAAAAVAMPRPAYAECTQ